ncbi:polyketide synthase dehydratase-domain-containing protein, partial [Parachaetomium inaequale]
MSKLTLAVTDELQRQPSRINQAEISQPVCTALQIALVELYASWNILPTRVVGHSSGEIAAAYATGALTLEPAMRVAYFRGLLSSKLKTLGYNGSMLAVGMSEADAANEMEAMGEASGRIVVACVNSPRSVTLSGDRPAISQMQTVLTGKNVFARKLQVDTAYHSHHMLALSEEYRLRLSALDVVSWKDRKQVTMFSSLKGRQLTAEDDLSADYWVENMVSCPADFLVELGPHSALAGPVKQTLANFGGEDKKSPIRYMSALFRGKDAAVSALDVAGSLFAQGYPVNLRAVNFPCPPKTSLRVVADLPTFAWNRTRRYWAESRLSLDYRFRHAARTDILGAPSHDWNPIEPRWRNFIRLPEQPWVRGHVVQKVPVYPAAGFCCMALQAAAQLHAHAAREGPPPPVGEYRIRDLSVSRALVIPQTEEGVEVSLSLRPAPLSSVTSSESWKEFRIFSYTEADGWAEHCRGLVSVALKKAASPTLENWDTSGKTRVEPKALYAALDAAGLSYGPEFQGIVDISIGQGQAVGTVQVTDTPSVMPSGFEFDRLIHPATMDAFLQTSIAALTDGDMERLTQPYVPTLITEIVVSGEVSAPVGHTFRVVAEAKARGFREVCANVSASAEGRKGLVQLRGIKCVAIAPPTAQDARELKRHCATVVWEPDVDLLDREKLDGLLQACAAPGTGRLRDLELLAYHFFDRVLNELKETEVGSMKPHHQKFFRYMQRQRELVLSHRHEQQTEDWGRLGDADVISKIANLIEHFSADADYEGRMFVRMGEALIAVLRQDEDPLALMMKDNLLYDYYTVGLGTPSTYPQVSRYITLPSHKYPDLDYLEIGAGTGGCTTPVLQALREPGRLGPARAKSYTYTDISAGFFEQAADKFRGWSDILEFRKLDVERDPDSQGFRGQRFDVIVAANVLHATYDMDTTVRNVRQLLRPGGKLILLDMTHSLLSVSLIFGNLPGWWNCREPWREFGPLLDQGQWRDVLNRHGFSDLEASSPDTLEPLEEGTRVMIASAVVPESSPPGPHPTLLIVKPGTAGEREHVVETIASELLNAGVEIDMITLEELAAQDTSLDGTAIISFAELDKPLWANISPHHFAALKRLIQESAGLIWVTRGGAETRAPRPELSLFHGLARSLRAEREGIPYITVDLAAHAQQLPAAEAAALILEVARRGFRFRKPSNNTLGVGACFDREFSEMDGILHIKRAIEAPSLNRFVAARANPSAARDPEPHDIRLAGSSRPLKLIPRSIGTLDSLVFDDDKAIIEEPLPPDHVDIDVRAVGLNFRDILICLGDVTDTYLGNECAGVVTRIGSAVRHLAVGDRVAAWCLGSFATTVRNPARCVQQIPEGIGFAAAAALPLVAVTAYYGLVQVARLAKGETVLIHAAAGGVGQAALQIAQMLGAKVFATVGSEEKKALLMRTYGIPENRVFSSRDLSFAEAVRQATGRRGVDVVLNSLAGEALQATWNLVAPFGRFVEIGKKDIDLNARLDMAPFSRNVTFSSIDVTVVFRQNPKLAGQLFSEVMELARAGHVKAATPLLVQPFSKIQDSMALMQAGKHMGKIVLEPRANNQVAV